MSEENNKSGDFQEREGHQEPADKKGHKMVTSPDLDPTDKDSWPVCPNCLEPVFPFHNYCPNCGSNETVNPLASYQPFVRIRFEMGVLGKSFRKLTDRQTPIWVRAFIVVLMFLAGLGGAVLLVFGLPYYLFGFIKSEHRRRITVIVFWILVGLGLAWYVSFVLLGSGY